jgi:hypothetical protein
VGGPGELLGSLGLGEGWLDTHRSLEAGLVSVQKRIGALELACHVRVWRVLCVMCHGAELVNMLDSQLCGSALRV